LDGYWIKSRRNPKISTFRLARRDHLRHVAAPRIGERVKTKKKIHFEFAKELVKQPLLYHLNRQFDVVVNIRGASVTDEGGFLALELEGEEPELARVFAYLEERGIKVVEGLGGGAQEEK